MTTIQTTADVGPDRRLTLQLPPEVPAGRHRVVLMVLEDGEHAGSESPEPASADDLLQWENGLLVYAGPIPSDLDICRQIELMREERMLQIMFAGDE